MASLVPESPLVEVRSFAQPTVVGHLAGASSSGLTVFIPGSLARHVTPGLSTDLRLLGEGGETWVADLATTVHSLRPESRGTALHFTYRGPLPAGKHGQRLQQLLDRRGATRVPPPRQIPVRLTPELGGPILRGFLFDLSATGAGVDVPGTLAPLAERGTLWTLRAWDSEQDTCLERSVRLRRLDSTHIGHRLGFSFEPQGEERAESVHALLQAWRAL